MLPATIIGVSGSVSKEGGRTARKHLASPRYRSDFFISAQMKTYDKNRDARASGYIPSLGTGMERKKKGKGGETLRITRTTRRVVIANARVRSLRSMG